MNKQEIFSFMAQEGKKNSIGCLVKANEETNYTTGENGSISGYFATFHHDHGDSYGDVIRKGAFAGTIERRKNTSHPFPLCFQHDFGTIIGWVTDIGEDNYGAYFTAKFFPTEKAQEIRNIVQSGVLWQFSFAFDVLDSREVIAGDGTRVRELRELELYEISIVLVPANPRAIVTDIKEFRNQADMALKNELLNMISAYKLEKDTEIKNLLSFIASGCGSELERLKKMEAQALSDIEQAKETGNDKWKERRENALAAIRKRIAELESE